MITPSWIFVNSTAQKLERCGKYCAAKTLRYLYNRLQRQLADNKSDSPKKYWLIVSQQKIVDKLHGEYKITAVRSALNLLIDLGIVIRDRTFERSGKGWRYLLAAKPMELEPIATRSGQPQGEPQQNFSETPAPPPPSSLPPRSPKQDFSETPPPSKSEPKQDFSKTPAPPPLSPPSPPQQGETASESSSHPTSNVGHLTLGRGSNPCSESVSGGRTNIIRSKNKKKIESTEKKLTQNNKLVITEKKQSKNPLPRPKLKQEGKFKKSGKAKDFRWGQISREFDENFREMVGRYLTDACRPEDIAACVAMGVDRIAECEINQTVIDYCVRAGVEVVREAISICRKELRTKTYIKKPAAFLVRKIQGILAEAEYDNHPAAALADWFAVPYARVKTV